jgi:hypothetical protein
MPPTRIPRTPPPSSRPILPSSSNSGCHLSMPGHPCQCLSVCSPPPLPIAVGVQEGAVNKGEYRRGPGRKAGSVVQHPQDWLRRRALIVAIPPSIVVFIVPGEGEEVPCPPPPLSSFFFFFSRPSAAAAAVARRQGGGLASNPGNVPTTTNASKRCCF